MNSLSWMIYLADVAGGFNTAFGIFGTFSGIAAICFGIAWICFLGEPDVYSWDDRDAKRAQHQKIRGHLLNLTKRLPIVSVACLSLAVVIPSSNVVYAIAASEMGETALNTETGGKAVQALNAWLDRQIEGEPKAED